MEIDFFEIPVQYNEQMAGLLSPQRIATYLEKNTAWKRLRKNRDFSKWRHASGSEICMYHTRSFDTWTLLKQVSDLERRAFLRVFRDVTRGAASFVAMDGATRLVYA